MASRRTYQPLFMFGFERSGTTLLSMIMGAHPDLAVPLSVTGLWYTYQTKLDKYHGLKSVGDLEQMVDDLLCEERIKLWDESLQKQDVLDLISEPCYPGVIQAFHQLYAAKKGKRFWGNLDIATLDAMHIANQWFPTARFIHIVRDGRDVALSHETMPYGASNTMDCARSWERRLMVNFRMGDMLSPDRYLVIRYEDLVLESEATLKSICDFSGIPYSSQMLEYGAMVSKKIPQDKRWLWPDLDKKPQHSNCYGWRSKMDAKRRIVFESEAGHLLRNLGYETFQEVPKKLMAYLFECWCFMDRAGRIKRLKRKLGLQRKSKLEREWGNSK